MRHIRVRSVFCEGSKIIEVPKKGRFVMREELERTYEFIKITSKKGRRKVLRRIRANTLNDAMDKVPGHLMEKIIVSQVKRGGR